MSLNETNVVNAVFYRGNTGGTRQQYQWDHGIKIQFDGIELPETYEVHFSNQPVIGDAKTFLGDATGVEIPDEYLETGEPVYVWIYLHAGENDGETVYAITVPVIARPRPVEEEPTPAQRGLIDQAITVLTVGVERVEAAQQAIEDMGTIAQTLQPGSQATVVKTVDPRGRVTLIFGIPQGAQGPRGEPGSGVAIHICALGEYDPVTHVPTIQNPRTDMFYLVPSVNASSPDMFVEWIFANNAWEMFGNASIDLSNYVKNTDYATSFNLLWGLAKVGNTNGLYADNSGWHINRAVENVVKAGTDAYKPVTPSMQHYAVFYGLAKAAGIDMSYSNNSVGTYTDVAQDKIQQMLGITDMIAPHEEARATQAHSVGDPFIYAGKLYKTTSPISIGDTITPGTNCAKTTLADLISGN